MFFLGNLIEETKKLKEESLKIVENLPFINLNKDICRKFEKIMKDKWGNNCICYSSFFQVETSKEHWAVCPHQYLALAAVAYDYAFCLKKYFDFFDEKIRNKAKEEKLIIDFQNLFKKNQEIDFTMADNWLNENDLEPYIKHIEQYEEDKDSLCYFLSAIDSKKFGNEKGVLRSTIDLFGSFLLTNVPLTSAASGFFGCLVYTLSQQEEFFTEIKQIAQNAYEKSSYSLNSTNYLILPLPNETLFQGKSKDEVIEKLAYEFDNIYQKYGPDAARYFGLKFKEILDTNDIGNTKITMFSKIKYKNGKPISESGYHVEIGKGRKLFDLIKQESLSISDISKFNTKSNTPSEPQDPTSSFTPTQIIYYGVPGCGKSHKINEKIKGKEENSVRVVFHPEYTNADFVGQIMPVVNNGVHYEFKPGPFTKILTEAYKKPKEEFYLVIEEINRGNAAAIFGDVFQLLDRLKDGEIDDVGNGIKYTKGWSKYFIQNDDINDYILKELRGASQEGECTEFSVGDIKFNNRSGIRLPDNLSIYATMNTSDQNVFTLDNAFQRRFDMELIPNNFGNSTDENIENQRKAKIGDSNVTWEEFFNWINDEITKKSKGVTSTEDKRIGIWFVCNENGIIKSKIFAEKVLKYLWDDAFKFKRDVFENINSLEELVQKFGSGNFNVFKDFPKKIIETTTEESSSVESETNE